MANTAKLIDSPGSPAARKRLTAGPKLYVVREITDRLHLCYRRREAKEKGQLLNGSWVIRRFDPDSGKAFPYTTKIIGIADDETEADGVHYLTFHQAIKKADGMVDAPTQAQVVADTATVREVLIEYVAMHDARHFARRGRAVRSDASQRIHRYLLGQSARGRQQASPPAAIVTAKVSDLRKADLVKWRSSLPKDLKLATVTRLCSDLKAALGKWYEDNSDFADPKFREMVRIGLKRPDDQIESGGHEVREDQLLPKEAVERIVQAARDLDREDDWGGDLHRMILLLAATGSRFSQIARLRVGDFQPQAEKGPRLLIPVSRKGRGTKDKTHTSVPVRDDVVAALLPVYTGRKADEVLLMHNRLIQVGPAKWERAGRKAWEASSEIARPWHEIRQRAGVPTAIPYALRHSSIVRQLKAMLPIQLVASVHDTSVAVVERNYAKHVTNALDALLRDATATLDTPPAGENVVPIRGQA